MEGSSRYFKNEKCEYYPCHNIGGSELFNCLFCYCPLYAYDDCPGHPVYVRQEGGAVIKCCDKCVFPHIPENYDAVVELIEKHSRTDGG